MLAAWLWLAALAAAAPVDERATCVFDTAPPEPCTITFNATADGGTELRAKATGSDRETMFVGRRQSGWWSGKLDGAEAMGYELNRGNVIFSTRALDRTFQYYTAGGEHGRY
jgi:hypothetical protein